MKVLLAERAQLGAFCLLQHFAQFVKFVDRLGMWSLCSASHVEPLLCVALPSRSSTFGQVSILCLKAQTLRGGL